MDRKEADAIVGKMKEGAIYKASQGSVGNRVVKANQGSVGNRVVKASQLGLAAVK